MSNRCAEKRKKDFAQATSQSYREAACGVGTGIVPVILAAAIQEWHHRTQGFTRALQ